MKQTIGVAIGIVIGAIMGALLWPFLLGGSANWDFANGMIVAAVISVFCRSYI